MKILITILCMSIIAYSNFYLLEADKNIIPELVDKYGIDYESFVPKKGKITFIAEDHIAEIIKKEYDINILSKDYESDLEVKNKSNDILLNNGFSLGTYGAGYHTLDEIYTHLQEIADKFGEKATIDTIGFSVEDNPLISLTIGNRESENGLLITSLHHAREPGSASVVIYFLHELAKKYKNNELNIKKLLEDTYITWVACVNPDGYLYNIENYPNGGGLWRKNRKKLINSTDFGVDLNRNYGPEEFWNMPNGGSSTIKSSPVYRGEDAFSEPETKAIRDLVLKNKFKSALNFHTFGDLVILPKTADNILTQDSTYFESLFSHTRQYDGKVYGIDTISVGYLTRGTHDDFMNNISEEKRVLAVTPEVGERKYRFYVPNTDILLKHCKENYNFIYESWRSIFPYLITKSDSIIIDKDQDGEIEIELQNIGLEALKGGRIYIEVDGEKTEYELNEIESTKSYKLILNHNYKPKSIVKVKYFNGLDTASNEFVCYFYPKKIEYSKFISNDCYKKIDNLLKTNGNEDYGSSSNCYSYLSFLMPENKETFLYYEMKYSIERDYDIATIELSKNNIDWDYFPIKNGIELNLSFESQNVKIYGYHGFERFYSKEIFDISNYKSDSIYIRLGMFSDLTRNFEGLEIKDMSLYYPNDLEFFTFINSKNISDVRISNNKLILDKIYNELEIYDINGNLIKKIIPKSTEIPINLTSGVYFLKFADKTRKILIY